MEKPEDILPVLDTLPLPTIKHYMGVFGVEMPQTRVSRQEYATLLRAKLESLVGRRSSRRGSERPSYGSSSQRSSLAKSPVIPSVYADVIADTSVDRDSDDEYDDGEEEQVSSNSSRGSFPTSQFSPDPLRYRGESPRSSRSDANFDSENQQEQQQQQQQQQAVYQTGGKGLGRKIAAVLLITAAVLLLTAFAIVLYENFKTKPYCSGFDDTEENCIPCPFGAKCEDGKATCLPGQIVIDNSCMPDPEFENHVNNICVEVRKLLSEQLWYSQHCHDPQSVEGMTGELMSMTPEDIQKALIRRGIINENMLDAFAEAEGRRFGEGNIGSTFLDGKFMYYSKEKRVMTHSICYMKIVLNDNWLLFVSVISVVACIVTIIILRSINKRIVARAEIVANDVLERLRAVAEESAADGTARFCEEDDLRQGLHYEVDDKCWKLVKSIVCHHPRVEREKRVLSGGSQEVFFWNSDDVQ